MSVVFLILEHFINQIIINWSRQEERKGEETQFT